MSNTQAVFDSLKIVSSLYQAYDGVSKSELHLISYLSALLYLYGGKPLDGWGYNFVQSEWGGPYSKEIQESIESNLHAGFFIEKGEGIYILSERGCGWLSELETHSIFEGRKVPLEAAINSALSLPTSKLRGAVYNEPTIKSVKQHQSCGGALLNDHSAVESLYYQFDKIKEAIGNRYSDLTIPSLLWLSAASETEVGVDHDV